MDDHTLPWLIELLEMRIKDMGKRDKTLTLKFCKDGAKKLLANLKKDDADASDRFLASPPDDAPILIDTCVECGNTAEGHHDGTPYCMAHLPRKHYLVRYWMPLDSRIGKKREMRLYCVNRQAALAYFMKRKPTAEHIECALEEKGGT